MKMKRISKTLSVFLCSVLIVAMALFTTACNDNKKSDVKNQTETASVETTVAKGESESMAVTVLGEGKSVFNFAVTDKSENETKFEIHTDKEMVGEALIDLGLIEGETGQYGIYVKKVNGIEADFDKDGTYWAFYVNGEYALSGADTTKIVAGESYSFKVEK